MTTSRVISLVAAGRRLVGALVLGLVGVLVAVSMPFAAAANGDGLAIGVPQQLAPAVVLSPGLSPDGSRAVYIASNAGTTTLQSIPFAGGAPVQLNVAPAPTSGIIAYLISPDSRSVVFLAGPTGEPRQLYRAPIGGGAVARLNTDLPAGRSVIEMQFNANGDLVYQTGVVGGGGPSELFVLPVAGGAPRRLNADLTGTQTVGAWQFAGGNAEQVLYFLSEGESSAALGTLYRVALSGGDPEPLVQPFPSNNPQAFGVSPDGGWVVYRRFDANADLGLFRVALGGGQPAQLNDPAGDPIEGWRISSDSSRVLFTTANSTTGDREVSSVPLAAATPIADLSAFIVAGERFQDYQLSADSSQVVLKVVNQSSFAIRYYRIPLAGGTATPLTDSIEPRALAGTGVFLITPDSRRLIYFTTAAMHSVPLDGSAAPITIIDDLDNTGGSDSIPNFRMSADGSLIIFRNKRNSDTGYPLFAARVAQANSAQVISGAVPFVSGLPLNPSVPIGFRTDADTTQIIFLGAQERQVRGALYAVTVLDRSTSQQLWLPLVSR